MVPARVSHSRRRYPLREFTRSGVTSPYPALHRASTSASIIRCANPLIISRSRSGLADARVSSNRAPGTGTMSRAAISFLLRFGLSTSKDHEVAVSRHADTPRTGHDSHSRISYPIHHSRGRELENTCTGKADTVRLLANARYDD